MMKRKVGMLLVVMVAVISLTGCTKVPPPKETGDFGITMEEFVSRIELTDMLTFGDFEKEKLRDVERYTGIYDDITIEAFCSEGKVYYVKVSGDATRSDRGFDPLVKVYGMLADSALAKERSVNSFSSSDPYDLNEIGNMYDLSDGETKDLQGEGKIYHAERRGNKISYTFTPSANRAQLTKP